MQWTPMDCDMFCLKMSKATFWDLIVTFLKRVMKHGFRFRLSRNTFSHMYYKSICIVDFEIYHQSVKENIPKISFVLRTEKNIFSVVEGFDIDICRIILRFDKNGKPIFRCTNDVYVSVRAKQFKVSVRTAGEDWLEELTRERVKKYKRRGYKYAGNLR